MSSDLGSSTATQRSTDSNASSRDYSRILLNHFVDVCNGKCSSEIFISYYVGQMLGADVYDFRRSSTDNSTGNAAYDTTQRSRRLSFVPSPMQSVGFVITCRLYSVSLVELAVDTAFSTTTVELAIPLALFFRVIWVAVLPHAPLHAFYTVVLQIFTHLISLSEKSGRKLLRSWELLPLDVHADNRSAGLLVDQISNTVSGYGSECNSSNTG